MTPYHEHRIRGGVCVAFPGCPVRSLEQTIEMPAHEVGRDDIEAIGYCCGKCGAELEVDSDGAWHKDELLNPESVS